MWEQVIIGAPRWVPLAVGLTLAGLLVLVWAYVRGGLGRSGDRTRAGVLGLAACLKFAGIGLLAICLVEPLFSGVRPRPGANIFGILVDNSRSMQIRDPGQTRRRHDTLRRQIQANPAWQARLEQDFDVRKYAFDTRLRRVARLDELTFDGPASSLADSLNTVALRFRGRPAAGLLLFSDGNDTSPAAAPRNWSQLGFPVYPVIDDQEEPPRDVRVGQVTVSQSNFETAPITILGELRAHGFANAQLVVQLRDADQQVVEEQTLDAPADGQAADFRFRFRPAQPGVSFYQVHAFPESERGRYADDRTNVEATLANNRRTLVVDRGGGPYRILYVAGRPNWEFKFLRRALHKDPEVQLIGLLRIAREEPKFSFRDKQVTSSNPLFEGFDGVDDEQKEQYDQPVLLRLGIAESDELRDGFPKTATELFAYDALILDDVEAGFFSAEQLLLLRSFVAARGGGLLLLGGQESFREGGYDRTALGELAPVYLDRTSAAPPPGGVRFQLTREGQLQAWTRLRATEAAERQRLDSMPPFRTYNPAGEIKPGASVLATVTPADGNPRPALVAHRFGSGQCAALLVGDLWRWGMHRAENAPQDLPQAWRQTIRWLAGDVPQRLEVTVQGSSESGRPVQLEVLVRDEEYRPLSNARVVLQGTTPSGQTFELIGQASEEQVGVYTASYWPREDGGYRVAAQAEAPDGSEIGRRETGWASQPTAAEFQQLQTNRRLLETIARETGGELLTQDQLPDFLAGLPNRKVPVTERWVYPLWHQAWLFGLAILCLCGEWGLRRWKGLP